MLEGTGPAAAMPCCPKRVQGFEQFAEYHEILRGLMERVGRYADHKYFYHYLPCQPSRL